MAKVTTHSVQGLPDVYTIDEVTTVSAGTQFFPKLRGQTFRESSTGDVVWTDSFEAAREVMLEFLTRMQY